MLNLDLYTCIKSKEIANKLINKLLSYKTKIQAYPLVFHWAWSHLSFITDPPQLACSLICLFLKTTENDLAAHMKILFSCLFLLLTSKNMLIM